MCSEGVSIPRPVKSKVIKSGGVKLHIAVIISLIVLLSLHGFTLLIVNSGKSLWLNKNILTNSKLSVHSY